MGTVLESEKGAPCLTAGGSDVLPGSSSLRCEERPLVCDTLAQCTSCRILRCGPVPQAPPGLGYALGEGQ